MVANASWRPVLPGTEHPVEVFVDALRQIAAVLADAPLTEQMVIAGDWHVQFPRRHGCPQVLGDRILNDIPWSGRARTLIDFLLERGINVWSTRGDVPAATRRPWRRTDRETQFDYVAGAGMTNVTCHIPASSDEHCTMLGTDHRVILAELEVGRWVCVSPKRNHHPSRISKDIADISIQVETLQCYSSSEPPGPARLQKWGDWLLQLSPSGPSSRERPGRRVQMRARLEPLYDEFAAASTEISRAKRHGRKSGRNAAAYSERR